MTLIPIVLSLNVFGDSLYPPEPWFHEATHEVQVILGVSCQGWMGWTPMAEKVSGEKKRYEIVGGRAGGHSGSFQAP